MKAVGSLARSITEILVLIALSAVTILVADIALPGFHLDHHGATGLLGTVPSALLLGLVFGILNTLLWPLLLRAMMWVGPALLFVFVFFASGALMLASIVLVPVATIDGPTDAVTLATILSFVTSIVSSAIASRRDSTYRSMAVRRHRRRIRHRDGESSDTATGLVCIQIDGLGHDVLRRAMSSGAVPTIAAMIAGGSHRMGQWHTDWSSQTGASQLGILHGSNHNVPAFRWYDKATGTIAVFSNPGSNAERERERAHIPGLLVTDGASRGNLFTGGADDNVLVVSRMRGARMGGGSQGYAGYFIDPANAVRTLVRFAAEVVREVRQNLGSRRRGVVPQVRRGGLYPFVRAFTTVVETDVVVNAVIGDMVRGRSIVYADLVGYDEVSHHCGIERPETLAVLTKLDAEIALILAVSTTCDRPYDVVLLSDHGQSQGTPFGQRYGESLESVVYRLTGVSTDTPSNAGSGGAEGARYAAASVGSASKLDTVATAATVPVVLASGNLGTVCFPDQAGRATKSWIDRVHPGLLEGLRTHPGIGFVLVSTGNGGSVVLGPAGTVDLRTGTVDGIDPLEVFGADVVKLVRRTDSFDNVPDIVLNGTYWRDADEIAAFEEQVGSHGGLGGQQSRPFIVYPATVPEPTFPIHGAESVHRLLCGWRDRT